MALKRKAPATTATVDATVTPVTEKIDLGKAIMALELKLTGAITDSVAIPDTSLEPSVASALTECSKLIGFTEYSPESFSSFYFSHNERGSRLSTPSVWAYEDGLCVKWGRETRHIISGEESIRSAKFQFITGQNPSLLVDAGGYNLPLSCRFIGKTTESDFEIKMASCQTAEDLSQYLVRGEDKMDWADVPDGPVEIHEIEWKKSAKTGKMYGLMLSVVGETTCMLFAPGDESTWANIQSADGVIEVTKTGKELTLPGGATVPINTSKFTKLADLALGSYSVVSFEKDENSKPEYGDQVAITIMVGDAEMVVRGNNYLKLLLLGPNAPVLSQENKAQLHIDAVTERDSKKYVNCRLTTTADAQDDFLLRMQKLAAENAENKKQAEPVAI